MTDVNAKIECAGCGKLISKSNLAVHRKRCKNVLLPNKKTYEQLESELKNKDKLINDQHTKLEQQQYKIEALEQQVKFLSTQLQCKEDNKPIVNNNTFNMDITNNFYVIDANGLRDGLDMTKLRCFGNENIDYVDSSKPLPTILKNIYCNKDHLENQVLSHQYLNLQWILFKYEDHILALNLGIDHDNLHVMVKLIVDNVQHLLQKEFPNGEERWDAVRQLLQEMDREVDDMCVRLGNQDAMDKLPIWNKAQVKGYEERTWQRYMDLANYSQKLKQISTKKWDSYY